MDTWTKGVDLKKITRVNAGDAHFYEDSMTPANVRQNLESSESTEKLTAMKWLLAMMTKGNDVAEYFPNVVKNVMCNSLEVKKMVYIYLVHVADYNDNCREIALLSINSFQKDLSGSNQLIRGLALRVMTSIRVEEIIQIQLLAVSKCATDTSPYVRKCAATALIKVHTFDAEQLENLEPILEKLLGDSSTMVIGSAVAAFNQICPTNYSMLNSCYRQLCKLVADVDEWSQVAVLEVLTRYARMNFIDPAPGVSAAARLQVKQRSSSAVVGRIGQTFKRRVLRKAFYSDEEDEAVEEEIEVVANNDGNLFEANAGNGTDGDIDIDHRLILRTSLPLLKSRNAGVVMGVANLHYYCGTQNATTNEQIGKALVRILRNRREIQYVVLQCISTLAQERPVIFRCYLTDFFIKGSDPIFNRLLKLEILTSIFTKDDSELLLRELQTYVKHRDPGFVSAAVRAVGRVVDVDPSHAGTCLDGLVRLLLANKSSVVVAEIVEVLRQVLQQNRSIPESTETLNQLVKMLVGGEVKVIEDTEGGARASIIWLVGEFHDVLFAVAPDVLRILTKGFVDENLESKNQILNFAVKLALRTPDNSSVQTLVQYVLEMSRYEVDTDLRDRSRFMTAMMGLAASSESSEGVNLGVDVDALAELSEHAMGIMLAPKLPPVTLLGSVDVDGLPSFNLGSMSAVVGHVLPGYQKIPPWSPVVPDSTVRDTKQSIATIFSSSESNCSSSTEHGAHRTWNEDACGDFYGDESSSSDDSCSDDSSSDDSSSDDSSSDDSSSDDSSSDSDSISENSSSEESRSDDSSSDSDSSSDDSGPVRKRMAPVMAEAKRNAKLVGKAKATSGESLLGNDFDIQNAPSSAPASSSGSKSLLEDLSLPPRTPATESNASSNSMSAISSAFDHFNFDSNATTNAPPSDSGNSGYVSIGEELLSFGASLPQPSPSMMMTPEAASRITMASLSPTTAMQQSEPKVLLKPELGNGLSVDCRLCFARSTPSTVAFATLVNLTFKNTSDQPIRRVRLNCPSELQASPFNVIDVISSGTEVMIPMEIVLTGQGGKKVRFDIRSDKGAYVAHLAVDVWDVIIPLPYIGVDEFITARNKLGGLNGAIKVFSAASLGLAGQSKASIVERIQSRADFTVTQGAEAQGELLFAGLCRKGGTGEGQKVFLTIAIESENIVVRANCEDGLLSAQLLPILK